MAQLTMDKLVNLAKGRGFVYAGSEIYGGLSNSWDYGPLGVEMKNNIKQVWYRKFVKENPLNVGIDTAILMNPKVWEASGHLGGFSDPLMDCKSCKTRYRADNLIEDYQTKHNLPLTVASMSNDEMSQYIQEHQIHCPVCGKCDFTPIRKFNLMFKTFIGVTENSTSTVYLRPETAQGIFVNFKNTPGNFIFRIREFEQMELEFFCKPGTDLEWFEYWKNFCKQWLLDLGMKEENLRLRDHDKEELCFYSKATTDFEVKFPFGWGELWGIADRTDYDLTRHQTVSGETLDYTDPVTGERYIPYVIEPSLGADRAFLAFLANAYDEEVVGEGDTRVVLHLHPELAPVKACVLPLSKKLGEKATEIYHDLIKEFTCEYDEAGSIGKRYRRQDEIGTPFCVTVDFDTEQDGCVTVRDRDTMKQERVPLAQLKEYLKERIYIY